MEDYISLLKRAREQLRSRSYSLAIKDLVLCPKKKVFSTIDPIPMTDEELYDYVSGQASHDVIERLFMIYPNRFRAEIEVQYGNVRGKIDIHDKPLNNIVDIKTSKLQKIPFKPFKFHEEQVRYYMAILGSEEGQIIYQMDNFRRYIVFPIYMTNKERMDQLEKLEHESEVLRKAIDSKDPSLARGIYNDPDMSWMCNKCPYLEKCISIRESKVTAVGAM
jgi:CRISPR/Cas system-associated exonuclease Cas4 (RecB family)